MTDTSTQAVEAIAKTLDGRSAEMSEKPENPPAFPSPEIRGYDGTGICAAEYGMTLRDYFAGQSIIGYNPGEFVTGAEVAQRVRRAYAVADAMLLEREKNPRP